VVDASVVVVDALGAIDGALTDSMPVDATAADGAIADAGVLDAAANDAGPATVPTPEGPFVIPSGIFVELVWTTPLDSDETDEGPGAGSNVDLHFAHSFASAQDVDGVDGADPWFDAGFDVFWFNPNPNWGSLDPGVMDDPKLDRDDQDGAGPELLELQMPEAGMDYRIGVHYWNDHTFGDSTATVRVYFDTVMVYESPAQLLTERAMWWVATVSATGTVTPITAAGGGPKVTAPYENTFFPQ